jgi:hypothetical protein
MKSYVSIILAILFLTTAGYGSGKSSGLYIGLHAEGDENEGARMVKPNVIDGKTYYFRVSPELVVRHFDAFRAFVAEDGATFGAALHLNDEGQRAMAVLCSTNQGRLARTIVNGRALDIIKIDRPGDDGYFIVWSGLTQNDLKLFSQKLKRLDSGLPGENSKKSKKSR